MKKVIGPTLAAIAVMGVLGCTAPLPPGVQSAHIRFQEGYRDGLSSGHRSCGNIYAQFKKNVYSYRDNDLYRQGWDDGFQQAKGSYPLTGCR